MKTTARMNLKEWIISFPFENEKSHIVANAFSELLENCIKYSIIDKPSEIQLKVIKNKISIETVNSADKKDILTIEETIKRIKANLNDLTELYIRKVGENRKTNISQLGLINIVRETGGRISLKNRSKKQQLHVKLEIFLKL